MPPCITVATSGLSDVCISALPIPRRENETSIRGNESPSRGKSNETIVITKLSSTVFLRPIRFISIPVGMENIRNQKNTSDGIRLDVVSFNERSLLT